MLKRMLPLAGIMLPAALFAADWPQWRGPARDDVSKETGLLKAWPKDGPKLLWTFDGAGIGYSGPAIAGDYLYTLGADEKDDLAIALDVRSGNKVWATPVGPYVHNDYGSGPRSTPTIDGEHVYVLSSAGHLACLKADDGTKVWSVDLIDDLGGGRPRWNYAESPLVDSDQVVCTPGGGKGTLAALDKKTGKVLWRSEELTDAAAYSSIVAGEVGGIRQYVQMTTGGVVGVAPKDGKLLWRQRLGVNGVAIIPTPIVHQNYVYVTSDYGAGCGLVKLTAQGGALKSEVVYHNNNMQNHHGGVVLVEGAVYGWSGNANGGRGPWLCQDFRTGNVVWKDERFKQAGSLTCADGRLYCCGQDDGTAVLIEPNKRGWKEHGRFTIPRHSPRREYRNNVWTHPVVANGRLYLRDQELLFCYDVKENR
jgi:outer membrane protein assembly factor BamB